MSTKRLLPSEEIVTFSRPERRFEQTFIILKGGMSMENQESMEATQSMGSRIMNVFASPSEAFDGITGSPTKGKFWVTPWLAVVLLGVVAVFLIFSNPALTQQIMDAQSRAIQQRVESGAMTQAQADQATDQMENMKGMFQIFGAISIVFVMSAYFFGGALVFWLVGKFALKSPEGYGSYLALYGLSAWVAVLGSIVTMLMIYGLGSLYATPSLGLAVLSDFDPMNSVHRILGRLDVFAAWQAFVLGVGLSKITGKPSGTTIGYSMGLWVVWALGLGLLGIGS